MQIIITNFVPNSFTYLFISQKIIEESKTKNNESIINDNFDKFNNKKKTTHIKKTGTSARILFILVFLAVKTFKP